MKATYFLCTAGLAGLLACQPKPEGVATSVTTADTTLRLPAPYTTKSAVHFSDVIGWPAGKTPIAPAGFVVTEFAGDLQSPRWLYVAPNGDVFVAEANTERKGTARVLGIITGAAKSEHTEASANRITLLRDTNHDGKPDLREPFLTGASTPGASTPGLNQPFGMLVLDNFFYVANTDGLLRFPYKTGQTRITAAGRKVMDLPAGGYNNHWTRNLLASPDNRKIYVTVGSGSNVQEHGPENEVRRANILEINPDGSGERVFASGLRNPVGLAWQPGTHRGDGPTLYTAVNERDELGDELVPDYLTSVKQGAFYGWPYSYYGRNEDPRRKGERPDLVQKAVVPDVPLGAHTASLGLAFYDQGPFPAKYHGGAFIGQHGSWNRTALAGYKVVFVAFTDGKPGKPDDFLTGFTVAGDDTKVYGRPVGVAVLPDGSMLVADDASNKIWRVSAAK